MTDTTTQRNYKKTLNLPKTGFPMRANLAQNEPASQDRWATERLYESLTDARSGCDDFVFHDGPPYTSGSLHLGHLLNRTLKDFVVRSRMLWGQRCRFIPGWDCHGLPIEHKVMEDLIEKGKIEKLNALSDDDRRMAVRRECQRYAEKHQARQCEQMKRMLTLADYDDPYLTMLPRYEQAVLDVFAALVTEGVVYRALKPVHWSIDGQTALADAELEYEDRHDISIFVDFEASDRDAVARVFDVELDSTPSFMIWTTTPWTLPANLAIAVHERFRYALVRVDGNETIIASELVNKVTAAGGAGSVDILAETDGKDLVGLRFNHPFCERSGPVVAAEYVTLEDGTGLVHTAPGHGAEDFATGLANGLETYCPVTEDGRFDDTVPDWLTGLTVWDANERVVEHLRESGHLFHDERFVHSYPVDWRFKQPVIFRATEQWFIGVDQDTATHGKPLRDMARDAARSSVTFVPEWGRNRMLGMLDSRPDWCLSRQRAWGLPIPAFRTADGGVFLTAASTGAVAEAFGERGSDAWFTETPQQLLATYDASTDPDAPNDLDVASLSKMYDIFDVWFESGSSWNAVMRQREQGYPIDLYLEGSDQHRGWFQLSLLPGLGMTGTSPFRTLLTHGFTVDKNGRKMSKSEGNALDVDELLKQYGADVCRWWVSSLSYDNDIKADLSFFDVAGESYRKVRNTLRFLLSNLADFEPACDGKAGMCVEPASLPPTSLEAYILQQANELHGRVRADYERYDFRRAHQAIYDFCNETLSAFYCTAVKDRLYCDRPDSPRRRRTQTAMWDLLELLCRLLAPFIPHTADEAFRALWRDESRCVHLQRADDLHFAVNADADWPMVLSVRQEALRALEDAKARGIENPLDAEVVLPDPDGTLARFAEDLPDMLGVSRVILGGDAVTVNDLRGEPRCERSWKRDGTVRQRSDGGMLSDRDAEAVGVG